MREDEERRATPSLGGTPQPPENNDLKRRILESKQKILSNMKGKFTGEETSRWLTNIEENAHNATETIVPGQLVDESVLSMPALMDMLFDHLQRYSFELNKVADQDLKIQVERPSGYQEKVDYLTKHRFMRGHLSTSRTSFVMHAEEWKASGYFVPVELVVGFMPSNEFYPYITISKVGGGEDSITWGLEGKVLNPAEIPRLARRIITQLVKVANGEASPAEKFTFASQEPAAPEVVPDRSFDNFSTSESEFYSDQPTTRQSRSQMLKQMMDASAREEDLALAARRSAMESGAYRAGSNGPGLAAPAAMAPVAAATTSGVFPGGGSTPAFQAPGGFMSPGSAAFGQPPGGPPPGLGQASPPPGMVSSAQNPAYQAVPPGIVSSQQNPTFQPPMPPPGMAPGAGSAPPSFGAPTSPLQPPPSSLMGNTPGFQGLQAPGPQGPAGQAPLGALAGHAQAGLPTAPAAMQPPSESAPLQAPPGMFGAPPPRPERDHSLMPEDSGLYEPYKPENESEEKAGWAPPDDLVQPGSRPTADLSTPIIRGITSSRTQQAPAEPAAPQSPSQMQTIPPAPPQAPPAPPAPQAPPTPPVQTPAAPAAERPATLAAALSGQAAAPAERPATLAAALNPSSSWTGLPPGTASQAPVEQTLSKGLAGLVRRAAPEEQAPASSPPPEAQAPPAPAQPAAPTPPTLPPTQPTPPPAPPTPPPAPPTPPPEQPTPPAPPTPPPVQSTPPPAQPTPPPAQPAPTPPAPSQEPAAAEAPSDESGNQRQTLQSLLKPMASQALTASDANEIIRLVDDTQRGALESLTAIVAELNRAMKTLQDTGVEAMQTGNFEAVQAVMEHSKRLKATKERLSQILEEITKV